MFKVQLGVRPEDLGINEKLNSLVKTGGIELIIIDPKEAQFPLSVEINGKKVVCATPREILAQIEKAAT